MVWNEGQASEKQAAGIGLIRQELGANEQGSPVIYAYDRRNSYSLFSDVLIGSSSRSERRIMPDIYGISFGRCDCM